jgi:hypothetical protein
MLLYPALQDESWYAAAPRLDQAAALFTLLARGDSHKVRRTPNISGILA